METFLRNYHKHIEFILSQPSGHHMFNETRAQTWISLLNPEIQEYGQLFYENIQYIKWSDLLHNLQVMLSKLAEDKNKKGLPKNVWLLASGKSQYIFGLLAYHFCSTNEDLKCLLPDSVLGGDSSDYDTIPEEADYYVFDDISYSGGQMSNTVRSFATLEVAKTNYFHYAICYITAGAIQRFDEAAFGATNMKCFLHYAVELESLTRKLGKVTATIIQILFNPESYYGDAIIYCDHKMADSPSTYSLTLQYGIIPPSTINFDLIKKIGTSFHDEPMRVILETLAEATLATTTLDYRKWDYYPFINGCIKTIPDTILTQNWEYLMMFNLIKLNFTLVLEDREIQRDVCTKLADFYEKDLGDYENIFDKNNRCPKSWYNSLEY